jgi:methionyl-tRNA formyltransferase
MRLQEQAFSFAICAVGLKGAEYLDKLIASNCAPEKVFSYRQADDVSDGFDKIAALCRSNRIDFCESLLPDYVADKPLFFVGWQHLIREPGNNLIILHDSLLPKFRGFAPTVNALIKGEKRIGVTAFRPDQDYDTGPIIGQMGADVAYPIRIEQALRQQAALMARLTMDILRSYRSGRCTTVAQDNAASTYSIWRDEQDYHIDWKASAPEIRRLVDAVSFPYAGAKTRIIDQTLVVDEATEVEDLVFELRHPGKVCRLDESKPVVICGRGLLRLDKVLTLDGKPCVFQRLRTRLS